MRFKAICEEVDDVLLQELHHRLLLLPHQIQPGPGAFDRVLAASESSTKSNGQKKRGNNKRSNEIKANGIQIEDAAT